MKVFLCWSGERSKALANVFYNWLPMVIQAINPWMSENDVNKGARWFSEISENLKSSQLGIICLTPENLNEPWIHFEAGALAGSLPLNKQSVCTYLFQVRYKELKPPLSEFQYTTTDKDDTRRLIETINKVLMDKDKEKGIDNRALPDDKLSKQFDMWWKEFDEKISSIPPSQSEVPHRAEEDILNEILGTVRNIERNSGTKVWRVDSSGNLLDVSGNIIHTIQTGKTTPMKPFSNTEIV